MNNLVLEVADQIAVLKISRPAALNALNSETLDELNEVLTEIEGRDDIKVVILTGGADKKGNEFKSFVAGADIAEMVNFTAAEARAFGMKASVPFFKLMNMRQVTIAAVNGFALGGGCEIAMASDIFCTLHFPQSLPQCDIRTAGMRARHYPGIRRHTEACTFGRHGTRQRNDLYLRQYRRKRSLPHRSCEQSRCQRRIDGFCQSYGK